MPFAWDDEKARRNLAKHGVGFDEAVSAFADAAGLDGADVQHSATEARRLRLAHSAAGRLLLIAYTVRGTTVRVISARRANRKERGRYGQAN